MCFRMCFPAWHTARTFFSCVITRIDTATIPIQLKRVIITQATIIGQPLAIKNPNQASSLKIRTVKRYVRPSRGRSPSSLGSDVQNAIFGELATQWHINIVIANDPSALPVL